MERGYHLICSYFCPNGMYSLYICQNELVWVTEKLSPQPAPVGPLPPPSDPGHCPTATWMNTAEICCTRRRNKNNTLRRLLKLIYLPTNILFTSKMWAHILLLVISRLTCKILIKGGRPVQIYVGIMRIKTVHSFCIWTNSILGQ